MFSSITKSTCLFPQGFGEQAIFVLDRLSDEALRSNKFQWGHPSPPIELNSDNEDEIDDEAELNLDRVEEDMAADYSEEEEEEILHINEINALIPGTISDSHRPDHILESNTNSDEWKIEVEKIAPLLKVTKLGSLSQRRTPHVRHYGEN